MWRIRVEDHEYRKMITTQNNHNIKLGSLRLSTCQQLFAAQTPKLFRDSKVIASNFYSHYRQ